MGVQDKNSLYFGSRRCYDVLPPPQLQLYDSDTFLRHENPQKVALKNKKRGKIKENIFAIFSLHSVVGSSSSGGVKTVLCCLSVLSKQLSKKALGTNLNFNSQFYFLEGKK